MDTTRYVIAAVLFGVALVAGCASMEDKSLTAPVSHATAAKSCVSTLAKIDNPQ
jgi:outer membrane murein-binding lipoprotein Lpp